MAPFDRSISYSSFTVTIAVCRMVNLMRKSAANFFALFSQPDKIHGLSGGVKLSVQKASFTFTHSSSASQTYRQTDGTAISIAECLVERRLTSRI